MDKILKIGHRGATGYCAENTLESFEKAIAMGCDGIELDTHLSADGEIIVIHDTTVDRTTNGEGAVKSLSLAELKALTIGDTMQIPTLSEVIRFVDGRCLINIEIKSDGISEILGPLLQKIVERGNGQYSDFLVSSFDWIALKQLHQNYPKINIGVLTETDIDLAIAFAKFIQAKAIHPQYHLLNQANADEMREQHFMVFPWTVNEQEDIDRIKKFNISGIITDFPDRI